MEKKKTSSLLHDSIAYDAYLLERLIKEHQQLLAMLENIRSLIVKDQFNSGLKALQEFRSNLLDHLQHENLRLHVFIQSHLSSETDAYNQMRLLRKDIDAIGRVAINCFNKYAESLTSENKSAFLQDWLEVSDILKARISKEERQLFPLYKKMGNDRGI